MIMYYADGRPRSTPQPELAPPPANLGLLTSTHFNRSSPMTERKPNATPPIRRPVPRSLTLPERDNTLGEVLVDGSPQDLLDWTRGLALPPGFGVYAVLQPDDRMSLVVHRDGETVATLTRLADSSGFVAGVQVSAGFDAALTDRHAEFSARLAKLAARGPKP